MDLTCSFADALDGQSGSLVRARYRSDIPCHISVLKWLFIEIQCFRAKEDFGELIRRELRELLRLA